MSFRRARTFCSVATMGTRSVCVAHASRIIACPLGRAGVAPRISVFSISPLKFSQSIRRAGWNSRKKNASYVPGDSSKYFRQLPFLFLPLFLTVSFLSCPADKRSGAYRRVASRPTKRTERRGKTRIAWTICRLLLCYAEQSHEPRDRRRGSVAVSQRDLLSKRFPSIPMVSRRIRKWHQTDFVIAKPALVECAPNIRIPAQIAIEISFFHWNQRRRMHAFYMRIIHANRTQG